MEQRVIAFIIHWCLCAGWAKPEEKDVCSQLAEVWADPWGSWEGKEDIKAPNTLNSKQNRMQARFRAEWWGGLCNILYLGLMTKAEKTNGVEKWRVGVRKIQRRVHFTRGSKIIHTDTHSLCQTLSAANKENTGNAHTHAHIYNQFACSLWLV